MKTGLILFFGIFIVFSLLFYVGKINWHQYVTTRTDGLVTKSVAVPGQFNPFTATHDLPEVVQRYFLAVLEEGAPLIRSVSLQQTGGFRAKPELTTFAPMRAQQTFVSEPRGFVWEAEITLFPGVVISVCDSLLAGDAAMQARLLGVIPVVKAETTRELTEGALMRVLAESVWMPTSLLPQQGVSWRATGPDKAEASITASGVTVTLEFTFNAAGEVVSVYSPARYREDKGRFVATPWGARLSDYVQIGPYRVPSKGEVYWLTEQGEFLYWRAVIHDFEFE